MARQSRLSRRPKGYRRIVVRNRPYWYRVGQTNLSIYWVNPQMERLHKYYGLDVVSGLGWDQVERGKHKGWFSVGPAAVSAFIEEIGI